MMRINRKMKQVFSLLVLLFVCDFAWGQESKFMYRADVMNVDSTSVYKIFLLPEFIAKSADKGLYDVRLADEKGKFVAYSIVDKDDRQKIGLYTIPGSNWEPKKRYC